MRKLICATLVTISLLPGVASAADPPRLSAAQWRHDLEFLAGRLPSVHPHPFHAVTESAWRAAVAALDQKIPEMTRNQILVGFMKIVAMIGEVHTSLNPLARPEMAIHYLPIRPYLFSDGLYVRAADRAHAALVGAKILRIGNASAEEAYRAAATVVSHDNDSGARYAVPFFLAMPEVLDGLGLAAGDRAVAFELEKDGRRFTTTLEPAGVLEPREHSAYGSAFPSAGWMDARQDSGAAPLWQRDPENLYWTAVLLAAKTFYIQYNGVVDKPADPIAAFFPRVIKEAEASDAGKLVIDVRANGGGNSFLNRPIVKSLIRSRFDQRGHLFVIIGRGTISAAQNFVNDLANWTNAIFVGEPTASNPNQYGDHEPVRLPESGLVVMVSTLYHQTAGPQDHRLWTAPQLPAEMSVAQYRASIDPALETVLRYRSIAEALAPALKSGDPTQVERTYRTFKTGPATSSIPTEAEVNALGYRLLEEGQLDRAIQIFRLNVESYPSSANVHDSLGEAYLKAGDRVQARESYRRSLALNPHNETARRVLAELGGSP
jgi:tetratricopeptide (TPR) repeat protein